MVVETTPPALTFCVSEISVCSSSSLTNFSWVCSSLKNVSTTTSGMAGRRSIRRIQSTTNTTVWIRIEVDSAETLRVWECMAIGNPVDGLAIGVVAELSG